MLAEHYKPSHAVYKVRSISEQNCRPTTMIISLINIDS